MTPTKYHINSAKQQEFHYWKLRTMKKSHLTIKESPGAKILLPRM